MSLQLRIQPQRLWQRIEQLSRFTDPQRPWTRRAFTDLYQEARAWLGGLLQEANARVSVDCAGNLVGRLKGEWEKTIVLGSHIDTVIGGGRFDGVFGVLAALEVASCLQEQGIKLRHNLEVVDFLSEEVSDYGLACVGSSALSGQLTARDLARTDPAGQPLRTAMQCAGAQPDRLDGPQRQDLACFLECHIEQGIVLERADLDIGVVSVIVGLTRIKLQFSGAQNHAGATPMNMRQDALEAFSHFHQQLMAHSRNLNHDDCYFVATVGWLDLKPGAANVIPGMVEAVVDLRSNQYDVQRAMTDWVAEQAKRSAEQANVKLERCELISESLPVVCHPRLRRILGHICQEQHYRWREMVSGGGHDAAYMASLCPSALFFIPSQAGISHSPDEWSSPEQVALGGQLLAEAVLQLDQQNW